MGVRRNGKKGGDVVLPVSMCIGVYVFSQEFSSTSLRGMGWDGA